MPKGRPPEGSKATRDPRDGSHSLFSSPSHIEVAGGGGGRERLAFFFLSAHRSAVHFTFPKGHNYFLEKKFK